MATQSYKKGDTIKCLSLFGNKGNKTIGNLYELDIDKSGSIYYVNDFGKRGYPHKDPKIWEIQSGIKVLDLTEVYNGKE